MAIESIKKVTIVSPEDSNRRLMRTINRLGVMEVIDLGDIQEKETSLKRYETNTEKADEKLHQIDFILNLMNIFSPEEQGFVEGLTPLPLVTSQEELNNLIKLYNIEKQYKYANELDERFRSAERVIGDIENELRDLEPLRDLPFSMADFHRPVKTRLVLGYLPLKNLPLLDESREPWDRAAWEVVKPESILEPVGTPPKKEGEEQVRVVFAFLGEESEIIRKALASLEFDEIQLPKLSQKISERIDELLSSLNEYKRKVDEVEEKVKFLTRGHRIGEGRRPLLILKAYWQNIKNTQLASTRGFQGKWIHVIGGYIREKDAEKFLTAMKQEFPESEVTIQDPGPEDNVPVSIKVPYLMRPMQLLVEMFGLPPYKSFDTTPFIQINFYLFFGICFSDVCYGIILAALGTYLTAKTKAYRDVNNFTRILLYGGISSIIFGALTGSWFGDLYKPEYLGEGNFLLRLQETFVVIDPMDKTIVALLIALGIGVLNQFLGLILKMYGALRNRDYLGAFSDGVCWIVTLTGLLLMVGRIFTDIPAAIFNTGLWMFALGAVGLVLTQGRDIRNPFGRLAGGVVSLYGIMGSYGITAFIGDTLSYCRLLALGLTTSIVAMAFNLMAGMLKEVPYVGIIFFLIALVIGHVFNIAVSVLGAFVHSMRLIFVEFFGRFYEVGSRPFQPLGFDSPACIMKRPEEEAYARGK
ncbi:MAG: V-type ATP synthase subunit I [Deltaproteobacteria bacterium]|nr:V-type ATP synthase subunit I [Deltaproteobacteria bacterium]